MLRPRPGTAPRPSGICTASCSEKSASASGTEEPQTTPLQARLTPQPSHVPYVCEGSTAKTIGGEAAEAAHRSDAESRRSMAGAPE